MQILSMFDSESRTWIFTFGRKTALYWRRRLIDIMRRTMGVGIYFVCALERWGFEKCGWLNNTFRSFHYAFHSYNAVTSFLLPREATFTLPCVSTVRRSEAAMFRDMRDRISDESFRVYALFTLSEPGKSGMYIFGKPEGRCR